jgi:hypothetical protein
MSWVKSWRNVCHNIHCAVPVPPPLGSVFPSSRKCVPWRTTGFSRSFVRTRRNPEPARDDSLQVTCSSHSTGTRRLCGNRGYLCPSSSSASVLASFLSMPLPSAFFLVIYSSFFFFPVLYFYTHVVSISALSGGEWLAWRCSRFTPGAVCSLSVPLQWHVSLLRHSFPTPDFRKRCSVLSVPSCFLCCILMADTSCKLVTWINVCIENGRLLRSLLQVHCLAS